MKSLADLEVCLNRMESEQEYIQNAQDAFKKREFGRAVELFSRIRFEGIPVEKRVSLLYPFAVALHETGHSKQAVQRLKEILSIHPRHALTLTTFGNWLSDEGKTHGAIAKYQAAIQAEPEQWEPYYRWGFLLKKMGSPKAALRKFLSALEKNPDHWEGYVHVGDCSFQLAHYKQALAYYEKALRFTGDSSEILSRIGKAHQKMGNREQAIAAYQACTSLDPLDGEGYENWGFLLFQEKKFQEAAAKYEEGLLRVPDSPTLLLRHGEVLVQMGKAREAVKPLEKAMEILEEKIHGEWSLQWSSILADCAYLLGSAYQQMGEPVKAKEYFKISLRYAPNHLSALQQLAMMHGVYREHHVAWEFVLEGRVENQEEEMKGLRAYRVAALTMEEALRYVRECEEEIKGNLKAKNITRTEQIASYAGVLARGPLFLLTLR